MAHADHPSWVVQVAVDTEVDKSPTWRTSSPAAFESVRTAVHRDLMPLLERHGARPTFFVSSEVLEDGRSVEALGSLGERAELASHLHADVIAPERRVFDLDGSMLDDFQTDYDPATEREKLRTLTDLFTRTMGRRPVSFRAGRWAARSQTLDALEELGYRVDSSVAPLDVRRHRDNVVDYTRAPWQPYHPARDDLRRIGDRAILEVPHTVVANPLVASLRRNLPATRLGGLLLPLRWLNPGRMSADHMIRTALMLERGCRGARRLSVNVSFHSFELLPGRSPYAQTPGEQRLWLAALDGFLRFARENRTVIFATLGEMPEVFGGWEWRRTPWRPEA